MSISARAHVCRRKKWGHDEASGSCRDCKCGQAVTQGCRSVGAFTGSLRLARRSYPYRLTLDSMRRTIACLLSCAGTLGRRVLHVAAGVTHVDSCTRALSGIPACTCGISGRSATNCRKAGIRSSPPASWPCRRPSTSPFKLHGGAGLLPCRCCMAEPHGGLQPDDSRVARAQRLFGYLLVMRLTGRQGSPGSPGCCSASRLRDRADRRHLSLVSVAPLAAFWSASTPCSGPGDTRGPGAGPACLGPVQRPVLPRVLRHARGRPVDAALAFRPASHCAGSRPLSRRWRDSDSRDRTGGSHLGDGRLDGHGRPSSCRRRGSTIPSSSQPSRVPCVRSSLSLGRPFGLGASGPAESWQPDGRSHLGPAPAGAVAVCALVPRADGGQLGRPTVWRSAVRVRPARALIPIQAPFLRPSSAVAGRADGGFIETSSRCRSWRSPSFSSPGGESRPLPSPG